MEHDSEPTTNTCVTETNTEVDKPTLTSLPCLTGLRPTARKEVFTSKPYQSTTTRSRLQEIASREDVAPAAFVQAAWGSLLAAYTGSKDDVGFLTRLPRGTAPDTTVTFCKYGIGEERSTLVRDSIRQLHNDILDCQSSYGDDPGQMLGEDIPRPEGTLLDLRRLWDDAQSLTVVEDGTLRRSSDMPAVSFNIFALGDANMLYQIATHNNSVNADAAQVLLSQFDHSLQHLLSHLERRVSEVSRESPSRLISVSNKHAHSKSSLTSLQSRFEYFAKTEPERVALEFAKGEASTSFQPISRWTYGELNARAEALASHLQQHFSILTNKVIPICIDRSPDLYISILGILKAGAAWTPIDPSFPSRRRHNLVARADAQVMILNEQSPRDGIPSNVTIINFSNLDLSRLSPSKPPTIHPGNLAYLIWTSGTTGAPKGVPITHASATAAMTSLHTLIPRTASNGDAPRCLQFSQFTFDVFIQDLFYTWGVGGTLISAQRSTILSSFASFATQMRATHAHLTPAFGASVSKQECSTLEVVTMIGEKLPQHVADDWSSDGCKLYNTYGPAETTIVSTLRQVSASDVMKSENVGVPMPTVSAFVIASSGVIAPTLGIGELALGGSQLSDGYWNDETRTRERFMWNEQCGQRVYMTGDVVRMLGDGTIEFVGREDDLVKVQGIRIELSEIAYALRECHQGVKQVEVMFLEREDRPSKVIVAFLAALGDEAEGEVATNDRAVEITKQARERAREELPEYMIPKVFLVVDAIPRTTSAKVDRAAMKTMYADVDLGAWERKLGPANSDDVHGAAFNEQETMLVGAIANATGTSTGAIGRECNLPSIGVDSITATRLASKLHTQGFELSVAAILECQSLGDLLRFVQDNNNNDTEKRRTFEVSAFHNTHISLLPPSTASNVELVLPVLPFQESLLSESLQSSNAYWSSTFYNLSPSLSLRKLKQAWQYIAHFTETLRTAFIPVAELTSPPSTTSCTFVQLVLKNPNIDWKIIQTSFTAFDQEAKARAQEIASEHHIAQFSAPLWAATVFILEEKDVLMFTIHHSLRDEPSLRLILEDLHAAYMNSEAVTQQPRQWQFHDAISTLYSPPAQAERNEAFWTSALADFAAAAEDDVRVFPELRLDAGAVEGTHVFAWTLESSYRELRARIPQPTSAHPPTLGVGAATLAAAMKCVWGLVLLQYLETDKVVFGETWSARGEAAGLADVVGPLVSVVPVPFKAVGTMREILKTQLAFGKESKEYYGVHPKTVRRILGRQDGEALYSAVFNFVPDGGAMGEKIEEGGKGALWERMEDMVGLEVEHTIALNASVIDAERVEMELTAKKSAIDREHLRLLARQVEALMNAILKKPDETPASIIKSLDLSLLSVTINEQVDQRNMVWRTSPVDWVNRNADLHPDWIAAEVVSSFSEKHVNSSKWTYPELRKAYLAVASIILEVGCTKRMIAVCLDRRLDVYAIILATMYTGNTYLPIAEDLPDERKRFLLHDSEAALLFTTRDLSTPFTAQSIKIVLVEDINYNSKEPSLARAPTAQPSDSAYLLYTSGSTGLPKGVLVSRGNLVTFIEAITHFISTHVSMPSLAGVGKWLGQASHAFDVHLLEILFPWRHGMSTITAPRSLLLDDLGTALKIIESHARVLCALTGR